VEADDADDLGRRNELRVGGLVCVALRPELTLAVALDDFDDAVGHTPVFHAGILLERDDVALCDLFGRRIVHEHDVAGVDCRRHTVGLDDVAVVRADYLRDGRGDEEEHDDGEENEAGQMRGSTPVEPVEQRVGSIPHIRGRLREPSRFWWTLLIGLYGTVFVFSS
jgi:hypothetical protein